MGGTRLIVGYVAVAALPRRRGRGVDLGRPGRGGATRDRRLLHVGLRLSRRALQARPVGPVRRRQRRRRRQAAPPRRPADRHRRLRRRRHAQTSTSRSPAKGLGARLAGTVGEEQVTATFVEELPEPGTSAKPAEKRSGEETFGRLMLAIAAVILAARLVGSLIARLGQPRVMGEVLAGILLGPTLLGAVWPEAQDYLFPPDIVPLLSGGRPDRARLLPLPRRDGARPEDPARADRPGGVHLERERRVPARRSASSSRSRSTSCSRPTCATCRSRSSWASRCRSPPSRCSPGS